MNIFIMFGMIFLVVMFLVLYRLHENNKNRIHVMTVETQKKKNEIENKIKEIDDSTNDLENEVVLLKREILLLNNQVDDSDYIDVSKRDIV